MRTTIDLPEDLHQIATSIARDRHQSLSNTVADLLRQALGSKASSQGVIGERNGILTFSSGRTITEEDVRQLEDEW